jgi:hypothetical protein
MKGQSAVEYIVTYGWAIFALLIVIGVIISSGILNPSFILSEECRLGSNLPCNFALFNEDGNTFLSLVVHNGFSYPIEVQDIRITDQSSGLSFAIESGAGGQIASGESTDIRARYVGDMLPEDSYQRFNVSFVYSSCAPELGSDCGPEHLISGRISGKVIPGQ